MAVGTVPRLQRPGVAGAAAADAVVAVVKVDREDVDFDQGPVARRVRGGGVEQPSVSRGRRAGIGARVLGYVGAEFAGYVDGGRHLLPLFSVRAPAAPGVPMIPAYVRAVDDRTVRVSGMVATALEVYPLADARSDLGLSTAAADPKIQRAIERAVSGVERDLGAPLVDRMDWLPLLTIVGMAPGSFVGPAAQSVTEVRWWRLEDNLRSNPGGSLLGSELGRFEAPEPGQLVGRVWPPETGWPARLAGSTMEILVARGLQAIEPAVVAAVSIEVQRLFFSAFDAGSAAARGRFVRRL